MKDEKRGIRLKSIGIHLILLLVGITYAKILGLDPLISELTTTRALANNFVISMVVFYFVLFGSIFTIYLSIDWVCKKAKLNPITLIQDCTWIYAFQSGIWFITCFIPLIENAQTLGRLNMMVFSIIVFLLMTTFILYFTINILKRILINKEKNKIEKGKYIEEGERLKMCSERLLLQHEKLSVLSSTENDRKKFQEEVLSFEESFDSFHNKNDYYGLKNKKWPAISSFNFSNGDIKVMCKEVKGESPTAVEKQIESLLISLRKNHELPFDIIQRSMKYKDKLITKTFIDECIEDHCQIINTIRFLLKGVESNELRLSVDYVTRKTKYIDYSLEFQYLLKSDNFTAVISQIIYTNISLSTVTINTEENHND